MNRGTSRPGTGRYRRCNPPNHMASRYLGTYGTSLYVQDRKEGKGKVSLTWGVGEQGPAGTGVPFPIVLPWFAPRYLRGTCPQRSRASVGSCRLMSHMDAL